MRIKISTSSSEHGLCSRCDNSMLVTTEKSSFVYCHWFSPAKLITSAVIKCSCFEEVNAPSRRHFNEIAWIIKTNKKGTPIGFMSPAERAVEKDKEKSIQLEDLKDL